MLTLWWAQAKAYAGVALAVVVLGFFIYIGIYMRVLIHQRDAARLLASQQAVTIQGYQAASKAAQEAMTAHVQQAQAQGAEVAAVVQHLQETLPKDDEQARQWAIAASGRIK
jgi:hypothetical protein